MAKATRATLKMNENIYTNGILDQQKKTAKKYAVQHYTCT